MKGGVDLNLSTVALVVIAIVVFWAKLKGWG